MCHLSTVFYLKSDREFARRMFSFDLGTWGNGVMG